MTLPPPPPPPASKGEGRRGLILLGAVIVGLLLTAAAVVVLRSDDEERPTLEQEVAAAPLGFARDLDPYRGLGAWIDVFDYVPAYQSEGVAPLMVPSDLDVLALHGVRTLYLQAARLDDRTPAGLIDAELLGRFLEAAHRNQIRVVAWYLPKLSDLAADLQRLVALHQFSFQGQRFDGLAVDIEFTEGVADPVERGPPALVQLSQELRAAVGTDVLGAIVLPTVLLEVVNDQFWPQFPWAALAGIYDVWLPMTYWTDRREDSGYRSGFTYVEESVRRMRANLGRPDAPVHPVGGIGDAVSEGSLRDFLRALTATGALGGSLYDARTTSTGGWAILRQGVAGVTGS